MIPTLLASATRILWRLLERNGVPAEQVFRSAGLDPEEMTRSRGRYPVEKVRCAWIAAAERIEDPCFGLGAARVWRPTDFHALGYAFLASKTLRQGFERIARYNAVVNETVLFRLESDSAQVRLKYSIPIPELQDVLAYEDARWAIIIGMCRMACGEALNPIEVALSHPAPPCTSDYYGLFRCPVNFAVPVAALALSREVADQPLPAANRELALGNDRVLADYIAKLRRDDIVSRVKDAVIGQLPSGTPTQEETARALHMSARTLQRRLTEEGTSFRELLEAVRRELAEQYLSQGSRSLDEISYLLGFAESSSFSRAFVRWTGRAPSKSRGAHR